MSQASQLIASQYRNAALTKREWGKILFNVAAYEAYGVGDETNEIQAAIDDAIANNAKSVFFPPGNYSATALTNLKKVNLIGDNATLTVNGESIPVEQFGVGGSSIKNLVENNYLFTRALNQMMVVPNGSLDMARSAIQQKTLNVMFWGDSITEGYDQTSPADAYPSKVSAALANNLPGVTINVKNYSLSGRTSTNAANASYVATASEPSNLDAGFYRPWSVVGKSWRDHIKDASPDLVIIAFGMNDGLSGTADSNVKANLDSIIAYMKTWSKVPSIVLVTSIMSTKDTSVYPERQDTLLSANRSIREYANNQKIALADANRLYKILLDGIDDVSRVNDRESDWEGFYTDDWTGDKTSFTLTNGTLTPLPNVMNKSIQRERSFYNGSIEFDVVPVANGSDGWIIVDYRKTSDIGSMNVVIQPGSGNAIVAIYTQFTNPDASNNTLTVEPGRSYHVKIEAIGSKHTVYLDGVQVVTLTTNKNLHDGVVKLWGNNKLATFSNLRLGYYDALTGTPQYTEHDLLGPLNSPASGNGINHPSGFGHEMTYYQSFVGVINALTSYNRSGNLFLPNRILKTDWAAPTNASYPTTTESGEKLYFYLLSKYEKSNGIALRRLDTGGYYQLSNVAQSGSTVGKLEPGKFAYFPATADHDFAWVSVPNGGAITWDIDIYRYS